jgi:hypothetical protein
MRKPKKGNAAVLKKNLIARPQKNLRAANFLKKGNF